MDGMLERAKAKLVDLQTFTVPANSTFTYMGYFRSFSISSITQSGVNAADGTLTMQINDVPESPVFAGLQMVVALDSNYMDRAVFRNTTGTDALIAVTFSAGNVFDNRLTIGSATINVAGAVGINGYSTYATAQIALTTTNITTVSVAEPTRRTLTVKSLSTNTGTVYIGNSGLTTANGHALEPGEAITLQTTALVNIRCAAATQNVTIYKEYV